MEEDRDRAARGCAEPGQGEGVPLNTPPPWDPPAVRVGLPSPSVPIPALKILAPKIFQKKSGKNLALGIIFFRSATTAIDRTLDPLPRG